VSVMSQADLEHTGHEKLRRSKSKGLEIIAGIGRQVKLSLKDARSLLMVRSHLVHALQMNRVPALQHADVLRGVEQIL
jgi:hypothetical protein